MRCHSYSLTHNKADTAKRSDLKGIPDHSGAAMGGPPGPRVRNLLIVDLEKGDQTKKNKNILNGDIGWGF